MRSIVGSMARDPRKYLGRVWQRETIGEVPSKLTRSSCSDSSARNRRTRERSWRYEFLRRNMSACMHETVHAACTRTCKKLEFPTVCQRAVGHLPVNYEDGCMLLKQSRRRT